MTEPPLTPDQEKPWQKNAANLLVVNSILAAIAALVLATFVVEPKHHSVFRLICGAVALFLFVLSAEKITESYVSGDVYSFVRYCFWYNIGVGLLLIDLVGIVRHYEGLSTFWTVFALLAAFGGWMWGWGCDTLFLVCRDKTEYPRWISQIEGERTSPPVQDPCDKLWLWFRSKLKIGRKTSQ